ncbi:MAG: hypothetical protein AB1531_09160 [Chloroflexota bacterium]
MYKLAPDEKTTLVMIYTQNAMLRAEAVVKSALARVSTWLRTQGAPEYLHLVNAQMLVFSVSPVKSYQYAEYFLPISQVIAFHLAPPAADPMDYDQHEINRLMQPVMLHVGTFVFKGILRIAGNSTVGGQLEAAHSPWISIYNISVSNPNMPSLQYQVPMALFSPGKVLIGMQ